MTTSTGQILRHNGKPPQHVPDSTGDPYKTEWEIVRNENVTVKRNWWHKADINRGGKSGEFPHSHPRGFSSDIEEGGYLQRKWELVDGVWQVSEQWFNAGDTNTLSPDAFHLVIDVLPNTVSLMTYDNSWKSSDGNRADQEWGYLNPETFEYTKAEKDPDFMENFWKLNPFTRKKS